MGFGLAAVAFYCGTVVAMTWVGGLLPLARDWSRRRLRLFIAFGGGVLLSAAFLHMIPEAAQAIPQWVGPAVLAGLMMVFLLERVVAIHYCEHHHDQSHAEHLPAPNELQRAGYTLYAGLTIHSLVDGLVLGSGLLVPSLGPIVLVALLTHKLADSFSLTSVLVAGKFPRRTIILLLTMFSLTVPVGALAAFLGLRGLGEGVAQAAIALSAGTFLYIALTDLLPEVQKDDEAWVQNLAALVLGIVVMWGAGALAHHEHGAEAHGHALAAPSTLTRVALPARRSPRPGLAVSDNARPSTASRAGSAIRPIAATEVGHAPKGARLGRSCCGARTRNGSACRRGGGNAAVRLLRPGPRHAVLLV